MFGEIHIDQANRSATLYTKKKTYTWAPNVTRSNVDKLLKSIGWKRISKWKTDTDGHKAKARKRLWK